MPTPKNLTNSIYLISVFDKETFSISLYLFLFVPHYVFSSRLFFLSLMNLVILVMPVGFWVEHLYKVQHDATLHVSDGSTWTVGINLKDVGTDSRRISFERSGWREFAEHNDLELGDVRILELIKKHHAQ